MQLNCSHCLQFIFLKRVYSGTQHLLFQSIKIYTFLIIQFCTNQCICTRCVIFHFYLVASKFFETIHFILPKLSSTTNPAPLRKTTQFSDFLFDTIYSLYIKNIQLADKLLIFSHTNLFAQDVIFVLIQLNSEQIIVSYQSNRQPQTNHKPPDFWILFLILNPKYVHVFKSAILFLILNPTSESLFQTNQPMV